MSKDMSEQAPVIVDDVNKITIRIPQTDVTFAAPTEELVKLAVSTRIRKILDLNPHTAHPSLAILEIDKAIEESGIADALSKSALPLIQKYVAENLEKRVSILTREWLDDLIGKQLREIAKEERKRLKMADAQRLEDVRADIAKQREIAGQQE